MSVDRCKNTIEAIHGLMSQIIKDKLFNQVNMPPAAPTKWHKPTQEQLSEQQAMDERLSTEESQTEILVKTVKGLC